MSDQPKTTTGEWTLDDVVALPWQEICDRHNAALAAAKQEGIDWADKQYYGISGHQRIRELEQQLAAEREKHRVKTTEYAQGWDDHVLAAKSQREELEQQLAAAQEKVKSLTKQMQRDFNRDLR